MTITANKFFYRSLVVLALSSVSTEERFELEK